MRSGGATAPADGTGKEPVTALVNRRGAVIGNSLASNGKYLYFSWQEDRDDLWIGGLVK